MSDREYFGCHRVSIAGQVKDAITGRTIAGATVKIIEAPDDFIRSAIIKAKFLPFLQFQEREILQDTNKNNVEKFQLLKQVIDYLPSQDLGSISQLERTQTTIDGWFYFINLPNGVYQLEASLPSAGKRFGIKKLGNIKVNKGKKSNINKQSGNVSLVDNLKVELKLTPTTLAGKVTSADGKDAIGMAKVQVYGTSESTFSLSEIIKQNNREWNYRLIGIEASEKPLKVTVSTISHALVTQEINLAAGEIKSLDFKLQSK